MLKNLVCPMLVFFNLVACVQKPTLSVIQKDAISITILDEANEGSWDVAYEHCRKQGTTNSLLVRTEIDTKTGFDLKTYECTDEESEALKVFREAIQNATKINQRN
jgi:hypothetical protein